MKNKQLLLEKTIAVSLGWIESYPIIYFLSSSPLLLSIVLLINFIFFYALMDKIFKTLKTSKRRKQLNKSLNLFKRRYVA